MCICKNFRCIIVIFIATINYSKAFRVPNSIGITRVLKRPIYSKHIDDMMFECAIYNENLKFPSNSSLASIQKNSKPLESDNLIEKVTNEVEKARVKTELLKSNINRIKFPILGRTTKPETKYLQKIYYLLEENNRALNENRLSESEEERPKTRILVQPRNITQIFNSDSISKCVNLFPSLLSTKSPLILGQESRMVLQDEHKEFLVNEIRENNIFGIFVAFVSKFDDQLQKPIILPNVTLCEFVDITELDTTGRIIVRAIDRFKIGNVLAISDAVIKAEVSLLRDSGAVRNLPMAEEHSRVIDKLYDRCNSLESEYRRLDGNMDDVRIIDERKKFSDKMAKLIEHVDFEKDRNFIYELTGFAGMEFHADLETKIWASGTRDTDQRLTVTIDVLKTKVEYLNGLIREKESSNPGKESLEGENGNFKD